MKIALSAIVCLFAGATNAQSSLNLFTYSKTFNPQSVLHYQLNVNDDGGIDCDDPIMPEWHSQKDSKIKKIKLNHLERKHLKPNILTCHLEEVSFEIPAVKELRNTDQGHMLNDGSINVILRKKNKNTASSASSYVQLKGKQLQILNIHATVRTFLGIPKGIESVVISTKNAQDLVEKQKFET